jgi:hypothetical protein
MGRGKHLTGKLEGETEVLSHCEVLQILSEQARKGSVTAAVALERALRNTHPDPEDVDDEFERLLRDK